MNRGRDFRGLFLYLSKEKAEAKVGLRELVELDLIEISLVAPPMQRLARVYVVE